jgi:hypothetical protein
VSGESVTLAAGGAPIELGRPFPLTVVRTWKRGGSAPDWSDERLAPLTVVLRATSRRDVEGAIEETRRYDAWAFERGEVVVAPPDGSALRLEVGSALPEAERARPGPPELPSGLLRDAPPRSLAPIAIGAGAGLVLLLVAYVLARRRRRAPSSAAIARGPDAAERALARLRTLEKHDPDGDGAAIERDCVEGAAILRDYLDEGLGVPAPRRTTEELRAEARAPLARVVAPVSDRIDAVLSKADAVKFAAGRVEAAERAALLRDVESVIVATADTARSP